LAISNAGENRNSLAIGGRSRGSVQKKKDELNWKKLELGANLLG